MKKIEVRFNISIKGYQRGPLSFLRRCVNEKLLIQVWIRSAVDLRGMCKGYLISFDKHFNLVSVFFFRFFFNFR